jgi:hypothetical protein
MRKLYDIWTNQWWFVPHRRSQYYVVDWTYLNAQTPRLIHVCSSNIHLAEAYLGNQCLF